MGRKKGPFHQVPLPLPFMLLMLVGAQEPPPNYSQSNLPETSFTCDDKATGGYYADPEAACQVFHVCVRVSETEIRDFRFVCPIDTVFDQQNLICANWWEIRDCRNSPQHYSKNDLFRVAQGGPTTTTTTTTTTVQPPSSEEDAYYEYVYEYLESPFSEEDKDDDDEDDLFAPRHRFSFPTTTTSRSTIATTTEAYFRPTTFRPPFHLAEPEQPFRPAFSVGKSVVAVSSSPRYESVSTSTRFETSSVSPSRNISLSFHVPSRVEANYLRFLKTSTTKKASTTTSSTTSTTTPSSAIDLTLLSDPFAGVDWPRVTAAAKTTYETRFGVNSASPHWHQRRRANTPREFSNSRYFRTAYDPSFRRRSLDIPAQKRWYHRQSRSSA